MLPGETQPAMPGLSPDRNFRRAAGIRDLLDIGGERRAVSYAQADIWADVHDQRRTEHANVARPRVWMHDAVHLCIKATV